MDVNPFIPPVLGTPKGYVTTRVPRHRSLEQIYHGAFDCWADVMSAFAVEFPEPDEVLLAHYNIDGYEGSAAVLYCNRGTYFYVSGSHCSCYGLEGQWAPEEYTLDTLIESARRTADDTSAWSFLGGHSAEILALLEERR
jgi:hypothetical protein